NERRGRLEDVTVAANELLARLTEIRATDPDAVHRALTKRRRRPLLERKSLFLIAADHPARGVLKVGADPMAMADRGELLRRLLTALGRPGVDGILGTADIIDDLALLGALEDKVVFGSMNRGGLTDSRHHDRLGSGYDLGVPVAETAGRRRPRSRHAHHDAPYAAARRRS